MIVLRWPAALVMDKEFQLRGTIKREVLLSFKRSSRIVPRFSREEEYLIMLWMEEISFLGVLFVLLCISSYEQLQSPAATSLELKC